MSRVGWVSMIFISLMEVVGTTQIGVIDDGAGIAGGPGGLVVGDEGGDALAGQPADLESARRDRLGTLTTKIPVSLSRRAAVIFASPKTAGHSPNARFVVTMMEVRS